MALKMYMGYSGCAGSEEGAVLVFANTAKEARKLTYKNGLVVEEFIDSRARLLKEDSFLRAQQKHDYPHVIESPIICKYCAQWGKEMHDNEQCEDCFELRMEDEEP